MTIKKVRLSDLNKKKGKSRKEFLENLSDEELHKRALDDPDNPPLTDEETKEFKPMKDQYSDFIHDLIWLSESGSEQSNSTDTNNCAAD